MFKQLNQRIVPAVMLTLSVLAGCADDVDVDSAEAPQSEKDSGAAAEDDAGGEDAGEDSDAG